LRKLLVLGSRDFCPLREEINPLRNRDLHILLAIGESVLGSIEQAISGGGNRHEETPLEIFTLVLEELEELFGGGYGHVETNNIAGGFGSNEPAFLIGLLGEIPELVEGTDDAVERWRWSHFVVVRVRQSGSSR
jgi:hypothetical protein